MTGQAVWQDLVRQTFRQKYVFPLNASHTWFPGHMTKGLKSMQRKMRDVDCVLEVHDARIPLSGRNPTFRNVVGGARPHVLILNKSDLIPPEDRAAIARSSLAQSPHIQRVIFTNLKEKNCPETAKIIPTIAELVGAGDRCHRISQPDSTVLILGIPNVGKSSLINKLRFHHMKIGGRPAPVGAKPGWTKAVQTKIRVSDRPLIYLLDTPGISVPYINDMHTGMKLAACATLQDHLVGMDYISDYLLWWLNMHNNFSYVPYMGLEQPEDQGSIMLGKSAIANDYYRITKDYSKGAGLKRIPDLSKSAEKFLHGFRYGHFGRINLDCDTIR